jgi:hypothetical protein
LSDYAPLENPEKAIALAMRLKEIEERGEEVLLITRHEEELEEANRMSDAPTDEKHEDGGITTPLFIPEIDELERRLAGVAADDVEAKRTVIREWVRGLHGTGSLKPVDEKGRTRRRYINEVAADVLVAREWAKRLNNLFEFLAGRKIHLSQAYRDYNVAIRVLSTWHDLGVLKSEGREKNRKLLDDKEVAIVCSINQKFNKSGRRMIKEVADLIH